MLPASERLCIDSICHENLKMLKQLTLIFQSERISDNGVSKYLQQYPNPQLLSIEFKDKVLSPEKTFMEILQQCPSVKGVKYGPEIVDDRVLGNEIHRYPDVEFLDIHVSQMTSNFIGYIRDTFVNLHNFTLNLTTYDELPMLEFFSAFRRLDNFRLNIPELTQADLKRIIHHCSIIKQTLDIRIDYNSDHDEKFPFSFMSGDYDENKDIFQICGHCFPGLSLSYIFSDCGSKTGSLEITDSPGPVRVNEITTVLPSLIDLNIRGKLDVDNILTLQNFDLRQLDLDYNYLDQQSVNALHYFYPNVKVLSLRFPTADFENRVHTLRIPWNGLQAIEPKGYFNDVLVPTVGGLMVLLNTINTPEYYWEYDGRRFKYKRDIDISDIGNYPLQLQLPVILLETNSINEYTDWQLNSNYSE